MDMNLLQRLTAATTDAERAAVVLEMSLSALAPEVQDALTAAAVPHWFDALFLEALLADESDELYNQLLQQSFIELVPGKGYAVHERTRNSLLDKLWHAEPDRFKTLSARAANYCAARVEQIEDAAGVAAWQAEEIYHRLVSDPETGVAGLRGLATKWANYEYHIFEEIEYTIRLAQEQIDAGRLSGVGADWTRLWQAKLALIFDQPNRAREPLSQINLAPDGDPLLAAEVAQTRGNMLAQLGDKAGMEKAWRSAYALYQQLADEKGQLDAYLLAAKMRQEGLPEPVAETGSSAQPSRTPSKNALQLIDNIHAAWIEGVLHQSIDNNIDLAMARDGGQASNLLLHTPQGVDRPVASGQRLAGLFAAADSSLLILGAPGSGKTITLLQMLDELLAQARADGNAPIPLLFNLSSFGRYTQEKESDLTGWLVEQAYQQYRINRQTTREQLALGTKFTLLLDGLDEVSSGERETCVTAINQFMQTTPSGLVVCSRIGDYQALNTELALAHALVLQPLANKQIAAFIDRFAKPQRSNMQAQIAADWQLREALRSPLLLNLYPQALPAMVAAEAEAASATNASVETQRQALFAAYAATIFAPPETELSKQALVSVKDTASFQEKSSAWLTFLAKSLQQAGTTLFFIEDLQPTWLPQKLRWRYRGLYGLLLGLGVGLMIGLIVVLIGRLSFGPNFGLIVGLSGVLGYGIGGGAAVVLTSRIKQPWLRIGIGGGITWLIFGLIDGLIGGLSGRLFFGLFDGLYFGLFYGLGIIISSGIACLEHEIKLRERVKVLRPSRQRLTQYIKRSMVYWLIVGLIFGLFGVLIFGLTGGQSSDLILWLIFGLVGGLVGGLTFGLSGGLFGGFLFAFLDTPPVDERPTPGKGMRISLRNALLMTLLAAIFFGLPTWLIEQILDEDGLFLLIVLNNILPVVFTWFGGLAWCQHWALRIVLARHGWLPWRLVPWLEDMTARGLLRRVGGGYIFIHRSLLEYFAALDEG